MKLFNIDSYSDAYTLISEQDPDAVKELSSDVILSLQHMDDFEFYRYYVFNYQTVTVTESDGTVISDGYSLQDFISDAITRAKENSDEEE